MPLFFRINHNNSSDTAKGTRHIRQQTADWSSTQHWQSAIPNVGLPLYQTTSFYYTKCREFRYTKCRDFIIPNAENSHTDSWFLWQGLHVSAARPTGPHCKAYRFPLHDLQIFAAQPASFRKSVHRPPTIRFATAMPHQRFLISIIIASEKTKKMNLGLPF